MKRMMSKRKANKKLNQIIEVIEREYDFVKFVNDVWLHENEELQADPKMKEEYALWCGGRLEAMAALMSKINKIRSEK